MPYLNLHPYLRVVTVQLLNLQIVQFISEYLVNHILLICLRSTATKKVFAKNVEHKLDEAVLDCTQGTVQLVHFVILNVPISQ